MAEPIITINGVTLTVGQAMTVRVAIESFSTELSTHGIDREYRARSKRSERRCIAHQIGTTLMAKKLTAKQRVLQRYPKAYARYVGLSLAFVVVSDYDREISGHRLRERDAWASAAKIIRKRSSTRSGK